MAAISSRSSIISLHKPLITGRVSTVDLDFHALPPDSKPSSKSLQFELVHLKTGRKCSVVKKGDSDKYALTIQPPFRGRCELQVTVSDQVVKTFPLTVAPDLVNLGKPARVVELDQPKKMTINSREQFIVTQDTHQVSIFDRDWTKIRSFGSEGSGNGQFILPHGVAVDSNDNIYIADSNNYRIQKFSPEGEFLSAVGTKGNGHLEFADPFGIAYNKVNGLLYIADQKNHRVQVLTTDLTFHSSFGQHGNRDGELNCPDGVCCAENGDVFVCDCDNDRMQVFTADGEFVRGSGKLECPAGVAVSAGVVYVSEWYAHRISILTVSGEFIGLFGSRGSDAGQFDLPTDVLVDDEQNIIVADNENSRLQIF